MKIFIALFVCIVVFSQIDICAQNCIQGQYFFTGNALDSSGNNNHGTVFGAQLTPDRNGVANSAYDFDGINDRINLPTDFDFPERTVSLWFNASVISNPQIIYESDHNGIQYGQTQFHTEVDNGIKVLYMWFDATANQIIIPINENIWYHAAIVVHSNVGYYYLNGQKVDSAFIFNNGHSQNGANYSTVGVGRNNTGYFDGQIDDICIFNCALTDSEILDKFNSSSTSVHNINSENNIIIYPNPSFGLFTIESTIAFTIVELYNQQGKLVYVNEYDSQKETIDISNLVSGLYYYRIFSDFQFTSGKLVIH